MTFKNTSHSQDQEITNAENSAHITDLIAIIADLDGQISAWKRAADAWQCSEPEELANRIHQLPDTYQ